MTLLYVTTKLYETLLFPIKHT